MSPNGSVGARVILMVRGGCPPVRGYKGMEWKYDDDLSLCGINETDIHVFSVNAMDGEEKIDEDMGCAG